LGIGIYSFEIKKILLNTSERLSVSLSSTMSLSESLESEEGLALDGVF
jgi:hypothetical protein